MGANISQLYRKSLQPYVDPEILEGVDYLPEIAETAVNTPCVSAHQDRQGKKFLILVLTGLCLIGLTYNHATNLAQKLPVFTIMTHAANE
ncbi:hypothetical protein IQ264_22860 [Phormidium sp. LEGE 05292]|uniref:hypothetical protein n=1 Tax=[Phormidium] sp. LEGE 05292 TaxID=767427 RepID=UPI00187E1925|nr:hypothetical protein [Phormidium sp. LEGE 05292]MBE9228268.1 hypothetical protein [Phormidium sp. LEGE 05292]